jgi:hypothetical protein
VNIAKNFLDFTQKNVIIYRSRLKKKLSMLASRRIGSMDDEKLKEGNPQGNPPDTEGEQKTKNPYENVPPEEVSSKQEVTPEEAAAVNRELSIEERIGAPSPFQLSVNLGRETLHSQIFDKDFVTIGRDAKCDLIIDNLGISRVHAQIERIGRFYLLRDVGSKTGTFVYGKKIEEHNLNSGDEIFLAKHTLVFQKLSGMRWYKSEAEKNVAPSSKGASATSFMQTVEVDFRGLAKKKGPAPACLNVLGMNRRLPITKNATFFGKSPKCDFTVLGVLIGDRHAVIVREDKCFFLYHLGWFKPPLINNKPVEMSLIENGDLVKIGDMQFIFQFSEKGE